MTEQRTFDMGITVEGHVHVTAKCRETGKIIQEVDSQNMVVNDGLEMFARLLINRDTPPWFVELGEGDTPATPADTALETSIAAPNPGGVAPVDEGQIQRIGFLQEETEFTITTEVDPEKPFDIVVAIKALFTVDVAGLSYLKGKTIKEYGIFNRAFGGKMFARVVPLEELTISSGANKLDYIVDWIVTFSFGKSAVDNGGIVQNGLIVVSDAIKLIKDGIPNAYAIKWGLTHIDVGKSDGGIVSDSQQLNDPITSGDGSRRITVSDIDLSDPANPVVIMQRYLSETMISEEIKEAGIFNYHTENPLDSLTNASLAKAESSNIFARVLVEPPIPANTEAVLTFRLSFSRKKS